MNPPNDLPPGFDQLFGNLKKPAKKLTEKERLGKELLELAKKYPPNPPKNGTT